MKAILLTLIVCAGYMPTAAQISIGSSVEIVTVYSQNEKFHLKSIPYDNESPSLPGVTHVFAKGSTTPLYSLPRAFDSIEKDSNNLVLSDDGQTILYLISYGAIDNNEEDDDRNKYEDRSDKDGLKSVSIYRRGVLVKSYTMAEITKCDLDKERCSLEYSNYDQVVDREKSDWGTSGYKKAFKPGVSDQEKFLSDFPLFASGDVVYLTDSKKNVHSFDLTEAKYVDSKPFVDAYAEIKSLGRFVKVELQYVKAPVALKLPPVRSGVAADRALAKALAMTVHNIYGPEDKLYKRYGVTVHGYLKRDGTFDPTKIDSWNGLPIEKIKAFFAANRFVTTSIPAPMDRWLLRNLHFFFRKSDPRVAAMEKKEDDVVEREKYQKRLVAETIDGRYIPKDLTDAFQQLDKELPEISRKEMIALPKRRDMIQYHHGLGTWIRNNWGLWSGSRLKKYFQDRRIFHPDDMSGVVLDLYWEWLHGKKDVGAEWEKNPKTVYGKN